MSSYPQQYAPGPYPPPPRGQPIRANSHPLPYPMRDQVPYQASQQTTQPYRQPRESYYSTEQFHTQMPIPPQQQPRPQFQSSRSQPMMQQPPYSVNQYPMQPQLLQPQPGYPPQYVQQQAPTSHPFGEPANYPYNDRPPMDTRSVSQHSHRSNRSRHSRHSSRYDDEDDLSDDDDDDSAYSSNSEARRRRERKQHHHHHHSKSKKSKDDYHRPTLGDSMFAAFDTVKSAMSGRDKS